jgi:hypothetical protein
MIVDQLTMTPTAAPSPGERFGRVCETFGDREEA